MQVLTGGYRFRFNWRGQAILQVETSPDDGDTPQHFRYWRDADAEDLTENIFGFGKREKI